MIATGLRAEIPLLQAYTASGTLPRGSSLVHRTISIFLDAFQFQVQPPRPCPRLQKKLYFTAWECFKKHCLPLHTKNTKPNYLNGAAAILKPQISQSKVSPEPMFTCVCCKHPSNKRSLEPGCLPEEEEKKKTVGRENRSVISKKESSFWKIEIWKHRIRKPLNPEFLNPETGVLAQSHRTKIPHLTSRNRLPSKCRGTKNITWNYLSIYAHKEYIWSNEFHILTWGHKILHYA